MHIDLAIEKLTKRNELDKIRRRKKITQTQIAEKAEVTGASVSQFFNGKIDSDRIEAAAKELLGIK
ncbi:MAG: helix-turn-helix domain-containing protein [Deferribacterales bacterium]